MALNTELVNPSPNSETQASALQQGAESIELKPGIEATISPAKESDMVVIRRYANFGLEPPLGMHEADKCPNCIDNGANKPPIH